MTVKIFTILQKYHFQIIIFFYSSNNPEKKCIIVSKNIKQQNKNVSWVENQHIRMISEGSCDTEDWSNNAENTALHH